MRIVQTARQGAVALLINSVLSDGAAAVTDSFGLERCSTHGGAHQAGAAGQTRPCRAATWVHAVQHVAPQACTGTRAVEHMVTPWHSPRVYGLTWFWGSNWQLR